MIVRAARSVLAVLAETAFPNPSKVENTPFCLPPIRITLGFAPLFQQDSITVSSLDWTKASSTVQSVAATVSVPL